MSELQQLPNISRVLAEKLQQAGIDKIEDLKNIGSKQVFFRLRIFDSDCCLNMLYSLEGAIQGIRWHFLDETVKTELKDFYNSISYFKQVR